MMPNSIKLLIAVLSVFIVGIIGCRVPYSNATGNGTDDTDTGTPTLPDAGAGGGCPDGSGDNFDNTTALF